MTKFEKFIEFVDWYSALGGNQLTPEQIENCYAKF